MLQRLFQLTPSSGVDVMNDMAHVIFMPIELVSCTGQTSWGAVGTVRVSLLFPQLLSKSIHSECKCKVQMHHPSHSPPDDRGRDSL